jgi:hypothetical protein
MLLCVSSVPDFVIILSLGIDLVFARLLDSLTVVKLSMLPYLSSFLVLFGWIESKISCSCEDYLSTFFFFFLESYESFCDLNVLFKSGFIFSNNFL